MQTVVEYLRSLIIPPDGMRWPTASGALSLFFGSLILFYWLRENFANFTPSLTKEVEELFYINVQLQAKDLVHPKRYRRARWAYVIAVMTIYLMLCLLGLAIARRAGVVSDEWARILPNGDAFPLFLAVSIVGSSTLLPQLVNVEALLRTGMQRSMAIPIEIEETKGLHYNRLAGEAIPELDIESPPTPEQKDGDDPEVIAARHASVYKITRDLLDGLLGIQVAAAAAATWRKLRPYTVTVSQRLDALKLAHMVEGKGDRDSLASFLSVLADGTLVAACLISATPRDKRDALLRQLELRDHSSIRVTWHETLGAQFICYFVSMAAVVIIGIALASNPSRVQSILYSWILPESLPFFLAYLVFFGLFSKFPGQPVRGRKNTFARLSLGLALAFVCALVAQVWWLLASVQTLTSTPLYEEGAILALGSVGAAAIAITCQNQAFRPGVSRKFVKIAGLALAGFILCSVWNAVTAQAYMRRDNDLRRAYHAPLLAPDPLWLPLTATFPGYIALSLLVGTVMVARRGNTETGA